MKLKLSILFIALAMTTVRASETLPLAGAWRFSLDGPNALTDHINLPGTMDDAGLGPKNTKSPTLGGPYRLYDYAGPAWYQRDIELPAAWTGKRVTLFLERCRWVTTVWLDDQKIGSQDSLIAPHVYNFGTGVKPGKHRLTICVDNTVKMNLGEFVSALFGGTPGNMNGIIGRIELNATPPVWIDDIQVYPDLTNKWVRGKVRIVNATSKVSHGKIKWSVNGGQFEGQTGFQCAAGTTSEEVIVSSCGGKLWDEFTPNLFTLSVTIEPNDGAPHTREIRTGIREFAAKGTQFTMNGRQVFLRGTLECSVWPLTGYPPMDVESWQRIYKIMKSYGLNHMRFHSWCPPEAAFAAADIEGIMIQAEGPMANVQAGQDPSRDAFIEAEFKRIVDTYGNHPSFCTMTFGNEYGGKPELLNRWMDMLIERDPRHLYSSACGSGYSNVPNRQWSEWHKGRGIHGPDTQHDLRAIVAEDRRPIIGHEIGQWNYYPDFNEIKKWTGVMTLKNYKMIRDDMEKKHLLDLEGQYVQACGKFTTLLYKEEIEVLLRTSGYAGFSLLGLHDYPSTGTALVGPLDAFWDSKGFISPEAFQQYCGSTVPLLRMSKRTYSSDETFSVSADIAHYGPADLLKAQPLWFIKDEQGRELVSGKLPGLDIPTGKLTVLGEIKAALAGVKTPGKFTVTVALEGIAYTNSWEIWVYPPLEPPKPPANVVVCETWATAKEALAEGKKVIYFAFSTTTDQSFPGGFLPVFWSPVWFSAEKVKTMGLLLDPKHPALAQFPSEFHSNWQWYEMMQRSRVFILDETPAAFRPTLQVIDNFTRNHKLGIVFEGRVGTGQLLVCGLDLPNQTKEPAARQLLASLYQYVSSPAFKPTQEFSGELLEKLFVPKYTNKLQELHATVRASSQHRGNVAANAIDGDQKTIWCTPWNDPAPKFPHELVIELPKPVKLAGITCLPRQDNNRNGWIKDYAVHLSADGKDWGQPVTKGAFKPDANLHTIKFAEPVETRFLKFVAIDSFDSSKPYASLAELNIITGE